MVVVMEAFERRAQGSEGRQQVPVMALVLSVRGKELVVELEVTAASPTNSRAARRPCLPPVARASRTVPKDVVVAQRQDMLAVAPV